MKTKKILLIFPVLFFGLFGLVKISQAAIADLPQQGDFLTNGSNCRASWPNKSATQRQDCINRLKQRGYTHLYVCPVLCGPSINSPFNFYGDLTTFRSRLQELVNNGIAPVVWLTSDKGESDCFADRPLSEIKADMKRLVSATDDLVSSYLLGLELDEYWTKAESDELGNYMQTITSKKIAAP
jgi:hypothetical protein